MKIDEEIREIRSAKQVPVIEVVFKRGAGVEDDPVRIVTQYWSMGGRLLAERDPEESRWQEEMGGYGKRTSPAGC